MSLPVVILTHIASGGSPFCTCELKIEVMKDTIYEIKITCTSNIHRYNLVHPYPFSPKYYYIRNIPYIPQAMLDMIKIINVDVRGEDNNCEEIYRGLTQIFSDTLQHDISSDIKSQALSKMEKEHNNNIDDLKITHDKNIDDLKITHSKNIDKLRITYNKKIEELTNANNKIQLELKQYIDKLCDAETKFNELKQSSESAEMHEKMIVVELNKKNKRLMELINTEKITNIQLTNKLSDITDLYESLLTLST